MSLVYSEEQQLLADTAAEFLMAKSPVTAQRKLRDQGVVGGFDAALWREMVDMGWSAIPFPEALGGLEFGCKGLGAVFEQIGRNLSASPLLSSIVLGGSVIELALVVLPIAAAGLVLYNATWSAPAIVLALLTVVRRPAGAEAFRRARPAL